MAALDKPSSSLQIPPLRSRDVAVVPFNRLETRSWELFAALGWAHHADPLRALHDALQDLTERRDILFAPSGQCAIAQVLSSLPQREVVMPAYMCHQVKIAAQVAG